LLDKEAECGEALHTEVPQMRSPHMHRLSQGINPYNYYQGFESSFIFNVLDSAFQNQYGSGSRTLSQQEG